VSPAPPDDSLPPALGSVRPARHEPAGVLAMFLLVGVGYALVRGVRSVEAAVDLAPWVLVPAVLVVAQAARHEVSVGPGWLQARGVLRRRWVRTDRLARVRETAHGPRDRTIWLSDVAGRTTRFPLRFLQREPRLLEQLRADVRRSQQNGAEVTPSAVARLGL
jgi:hypothetical protein